MLGTATTRRPAVSESAVRLCRVGANALILDAISEPSAGAKVAGAILGTGTERKGKAVAVYVFPAGSLSTGGAADSARTR